MSERRGSKFNRFVDKYIGFIAMLPLLVLLKLKRILFPLKFKDDDSYLLVCFGAIGDLIILTQAARYQLAGKRVYLACSHLNLAAANLFKEFYADIKQVDLKDILSLHNIAREFEVGKIIDSTQWANIGPIQVAFAELLGGNLVTVGFMTNAFIRNNIYGQRVAHSEKIHELGNFVNLIAQRCKITSNDQLDSVVPELYSNSACRLTGNVLLHLWPSGNRSYLKAWPENYWIDLTKQLVRRGYKVYLSGSLFDKDKTEAFARKFESDKVINLAGFFDLAGLREFIHDQIEFAISVNTGILHLVASCGVPIVGLHGPTNPIRWGPLGCKSISLLPQSGHSAYLHYGFEYPDDDEEAYVLDRLSVTQVISAVDSLLADN